MSAASKVIARCRELARVTDVPGETTRTFLSPAMRQANDLVAVWMREAGLRVRVDGAGNLRGVQGVRGKQGRKLLLGSHLDTVPNAGAFDGPLGVLIGVAIAEALRDEELPFALEVIGFSEEEGVRFGVPFIGSRAVAGTLDELLERRDHDGVTVREALRAYGLGDAPVRDANETEAIGFLEFHIEQGPVLESEGLPLGVVETIAGQSRYEVLFTGQANHAGTTPMRLRHDAMAAAAAWIAEVERYAAATPTVVATVGSVQTLPGVGNVIAGTVRASLDVRAARDVVREDALAHMLRVATASGEARGVQVVATERMEQRAVPLDDGWLRLLEDAVDATGTPIRRMVSGAGHDAMVLARVMPAAMLFLRSPGGVSHHPEESVVEGDVELALQAGIAFVRTLAARERADA